MIKVSDRECTQEGIRASIPPKLQKLDLTTDAEYVANLLPVCGCKRAAVKFVTWMGYAVSA